MIRGSAGISYVIFLYFNQCCKKPIASLAFLPNFHILHFFVLRHLLERTRPVANEYWAEKGCLRVLFWLWFNILNALLKIASSAESYFERDLGCKHHGNEPSHLLVWVRFLGHNLLIIDIGLFWKGHICNLFNNIRSHLSLWNALIPLHEQE